MILERFYSLSQQRVVPDNLLDEVLSLTQKSLPTTESIEQMKKHSALGEVLGAGLLAMQQNPLCSEIDFRAQLEAAGRRVSVKLEKYLSALGSIASAAPLLGLFGTVVGMIEIFGAQAPGSGNPAQLAHGISVALYNTAFGLVIAIPSLVAWRYFKTQVDHFVLELEIGSERFARHFFPSRPGK